MFFYRVVDSFDCLIWIIKYYLSVSMGIFLEWKEHRYLHVGHVTVRLVLWRAGGGRAMHRRRCQGGHAARGRPRPPPLGWWGGGASSRPRSGPARSPARMAVRGPAQSRSRWPGNGLAAVDMDDAQYLLDGMPPRQTADWTNFRPRHPGPCLTCVRWNCCCS